ncbi:MAG: MarR family winged helix-turn-helix transcriptional regulator [Planctomycetaceae bacterium]
MSDLRPEFRPLTFPRSAEPNHPAAVATPAYPVGGEVHHGPVHHESEPGIESRDPERYGPQCDADDDGDCDLDPVGEYDPIDSHDTVSIAGRIGGSTGELTPGELVEMLLRLGQRLRGHLDTRFGTFGLSDARFAALSVIREAAPAGCTQAHLATKLGQCESSISTLVERMRASRLLYRLRAKADRRKRVLMLTDDGRQLFDQGLAARDREAGSLFSRMSEDEQRQLAGLLGRLFATLDRIGETPERIAERDAA